MKLARLIVAIVLLSGGAVFGGAQAQEDVDCGTGDTQAAMNDCADRDCQTAAKAMNAAYRQTLWRSGAADRAQADLDGGMTGAVDALKSAHRAWIGYRDGQCTLAGFEARCGSMEPMPVSGCLADLTVKRTEELNETLKDQ